MLPNILVSDFIGVLSLSANRFKSEQYNSYITQFIAEYTNLLLGTEAYIKIQTSINPKWALLFDGGTYEYVEDGITLYGRLYGFTEVLKYLIYFNIVRDDFTMSEVGAVNNANENSVRVRQYTIAQDRYNQAVTYLNEVYAFIDRNMEVIYPVTAVDNTGTYSLTIEGYSLPFLENGDVVTIDDVDYTISNLTSTITTGTPNTYTTTFDIVGTDLTIVEILVRPFDLIIQADFKYSYL